MLLLSMPLFCAVLLAVSLMSRAFRLLVVMVFVFSVATATWERTRVHSVKKEACVTATAQLVP